MHGPFIYAALLLLLGLTDSAKTQQPAMSYRLNPGDSFYLETDLQQSTHSESIESEEISFYNLIRMEFTVDSVDQARQFYMRVRYRDLMISMLAPRLEIDISSASGKDQLLTEMVELLERDTFQVCMTPRGEVVGLEGLEKIFVSLSSLQVTDTTEQQVILKTLEEAYGPDAFRSLCNLFLWIYPVMNPMSNWTNDISYYFNTKEVHMVNRYTLTKATEDGVVIQGLGMLNTSREFFETTGMGEVKSIVSGSQTYDFQMDPQTGWLKRCISRQRLLIETTVIESSYLPAGLKIPSYTETVFEVKGGKTDNAM